MNTKRAYPKDVKNFEYDGDEAKILESFNWRLQLENYLSIGPGWIFEDNKKTLVLAGYYQLSPGVLQVWMLFNKSAKHFAKSLVKEFRQILSEGMELQGIHRIQTLIDSTKEKDEAFAKLVGFKKEAKLEAFGPRKEDVILYKMLKCS